MRTRAWVGVFVVVSIVTRTSQAQEEPEENAVPPTQSPPPPPPPPPPPSPPPTQAAAAANEQPAYRLPMRFSERPLTLPHSILALDVGGGVVSVKSSSSSNSVLGAVGVFGAQVGVVDNLTLRAAPVAMTFAPEVQYTGAVVAGATFRFLRGLLDMGASLDLQYHAVDPSGASILFGLPMLFHLGQYARLDVAPQFASISRSVSTNGVALPISFTIQPADRFFFGGTGSVSTLAKTQRTRGSTTLSAGGYLGVTLGPADGPLVDLRPSVEWSSLRIDDSDTSLDVLAGGLDVIGHLAL